MNLRAFFALFLSLFAFAAFASATGVTAPQWTSNSTNVANGTVFSSGQYITFNTSWDNTSALTSLVFSLNGTNSTLSAKANTNVSFTGLKVGTYNWYFFASNGTVNQTDTYTFVIAQNTTPAIVLHLNSSASNLTSGVSLTVNTTVLSVNTGYNVTVTLYRNGTNVTSTLNALPFTNMTNESTVGTVNWTAVFAGDENYSKTLTTLFVNVRDIPALNVFSTGLANGTNYSLSLYASFNASWVAGSGLSLSSVIFNLNGTNYTMSSTTSNLTSTGLKAGQYSYYTFANDSVGNRNQSATKTFNLSVAVPYPVFAVNGISTDWTATTGVTFTSYVSSSGKGYDSNTTIYRNGAYANSGTSTVSYASAEGVGVYNMSAYTGSDENFTTGITTVTLTVVASTITSGNSGSGGSSCSGSGCAGSTATATATASATATAAPTATATATAAPTSSATATPAATASVEASATPEASASVQAQSVTQTATAGETLTITVAAGASVVVTAPDGTSQTLTADSNGLVALNATQTGTYQFSLASGSSGASGSVPLTVTAQTPQEVAQAAQQASQPASGLPPWALPLVVVIVVLALVGYWVMNRSPKGL